MISARSLALLALSTGLATLSTAQDVSGSGTTTRYWDCCKGSCAWTGKADVSNPVTSCDAADQPLSSYDTASGCNGGVAYMCSSQSPWAVNSTMAYGFAAVSIPGGTEASWCCACYELTFTSTSIAGKKMIVQATNTGGDLAQGQFDLAIPGGGVGIFNGCTEEWGAPSEGWGAQYGGISTDTCATFPTALQPGCSFRFGDFFEGADNPTVDYKQVTCPKVLTDKTGCVRSGETPTGGDESASSSTAERTASSTATASSSDAPATISTAAALSRASAVSSSPVASSSSLSAPASSAYSAPAVSSSSPSPPPSPVDSSSSSEAAPVSASSATVTAVSSPYSFTAPYGSVSIPVAATGTGGSAAPSGYDPAPPSDDGQCAMQYVYEYI